MAKIEKTPLEMNGVQVRDIEALKANFDVEKVLEYFRSGELATWLEARYYEDEAAAVAALDASDSELTQKLCAVFGMELSLDVGEQAEQQRRIARLRQYTDDEEIIRNMDHVAFDQEELASLYDQGVEKIYLCTGKFSIPKSKAGLEYVLIGNATGFGLHEVAKEEQKSEKKKYSIPQEESMKKEWQEYEKHSVGITCSEKELKAIDFCESIRSWEEKIYQKKIIHFSCGVYCDGDLTFENCVLHCGENDDGTIDFNRGSLTIRNCKILGHRSGHTSLINAINAEEGRASICIESCEFVNVGEFLFSGIDLDIVRCRVYDAREGLVYVCDGKKARFKDCEFSFLKKKRNDFMYDNACVIGGGCAILDHCLFKGRQDLSGLSSFPAHIPEDMEDELEDLMWEARDYEMETLSIAFLNVRKCEMNDCFVSGLYFDGSKMTIHDSCFDNCSIGFDEGEVHKCTFNTSVLGIGEEDYSTLSDSQFYGCVIAGERDETCKYIDCKFADQAPFNYFYYES